MMTVEHHIGRLCEARFIPPFKLVDFEPFATAVGRAILKVGRPTIFCCDARRVTAFPPDLSDRLTVMMRGENPLVEKQGMLYGGSSVFGMQIERMFREAGNRGRRAFTQAADVVAWLSESLNREEQQRLSTFIAKGK